LAHWRTARRSGRTRSRRRSCCSGASHGWRARLAWSRARGCGPHRNLGFRSCWSCRGRSNSWFHSCGWRPGNRRHGWPCGSRNCSRRSRTRRHKSWPGRDSARSSRGCHRSRVSSRWRAWLRGCRLCRNGHRSRGCRAGRRPRLCCGCLGLFIRFGGRFLRSQFAEMLPHEFSVAVVKRTRVGFLFRDTNFRKVVNQDLGLDFELPGQLVDSDLIGIWH
jgi:hypothetical protein